MRDYFSIVQLVSSILLTLSILVQTKGSGLGEAFGGSNVFFSIKRGPEKILFISSIVLAIVFFVSSFLLSIFK